MLYLFCGSIWKIPQSPEAVLDQTLAGVCQVKSQSLHSSYTQVERHTHKNTTSTFITTEDFHLINKPQLQNVSETSNDIHTCTAMSWTITFIFMYVCICILFSYLYHDYIRTSLYNGRFVAWTNREHLEHSTCGPQQFLICEGPHYVDQGLGTSAGQNDQLQPRQVYP